MIVLCTIGVLAIVTVVLVFTLSSGSEIIDLDQDPAIQSQNGEEVDE